MFNKNWARWIKASVYTFMNSLDRSDVTLPVNPPPLYPEGANRKDTDQISLELRFNGPSITPLHANMFLVRCAINIIYSNVTSDKDLYIYDKLKGLAIAMHQNMQIFRFGNVAGDDGSFLFCLFLDAEQEVEVTDFNVLNEKTRIQQGCVTGYYVGHIET